MIAAKMIKNMKITFLHDFGQTFGQLQKWRYMYIFASNLVKF